MSATVFRSALRANAFVNGFSSSSIAAQSVSRVVRRYASEQARLRLGSSAPNFKAKTTAGEIDFHEWKKGSWAVLFSHPADFTPVCTTELGAFAKFKEEWESKNIKMIGLSTNGLGHHEEWINDIKDVTSNTVSFPLIADDKREVAYLYDMIDASEIGKPNSEGLPVTIRSVFIIDPNNKIRLTMSYPPAIGRNTAEVARVLEALQTHEKHGIVTPIDWTQGKDVIVPPTVSTEDAKKKFGQVREAKPYLRWVNVNDK